MSGAYYEKLARINLTTGEIKVEKLDLDLAHKFIGGRGLGTKLLYDDGCASVDPLSPENKIIFGLGCLQAAPNFPGNAKWSVITKGPLTGSFLDSAGTGAWAPEFKKAGNRLYLVKHTPLGNYMPDVDQLKANWDYVHGQILAKNIVSAYAIVSG